jgi:hypothetical protein
MRSRKLFLIAAAGLVSAVFAYLGTGFHPIWWALWLAPIPVLALAPRSRSSVAFLLGAIVWLIGEMNQWNYVRHGIELPPLITVPYFVVPAAVFGLGVLFVRSFIRRGSPFPRLACFLRLLGDVRIPHHAHSQERGHMQQMPGNRTLSKVFHWCEPSRSGEVAAATAKCSGRRAACNFQS